MVSLALILPKKWSLVTEKLGLKPRPFRTTLEEKTRKALGVETWTDSQVLFS
jgi:hypothetical protein